MILVVQNTNGKYLCLFWLLSDGYSFKTQINITAADIGNSIISICTKNIGVGKKPNKRCSSTDGTSGGGLNDQNNYSRMIRKVNPGPNSQSQAMKRKISTISKGSKQNIVKSKNRKYFKAAKDISSILQYSKETRNPQHDYIDQNPPKHRYTEFDSNDGSKTQERSSDSQNRDKNNSSFLISY